MQGLMLIVAASHLLMAQSPDIILSRLLGNSKLKEAQAYVQRNGQKLLKASSLKDVTVDEQNNLIVVRKGSQEGPFVAVMARVDSPQAVSSLVAIANALDAAGIVTKAGLLFVGISKPEDASDDRAGLRYFLESGSYHNRVRSCVLIQASAENTVFGPPNSIGSTIVQYGLQSVDAYSTGANYEPAKGILTVPVELRIPAIGMGTGEAAVSVKGIQAVMTAVLAIAGV